MSKSKTKYSLYCTSNNKTYKNAYEAAEDLGYTHLHIRLCLTKTIKPRIILV